MCDTYKARLATNCGPGELLSISRSCGTTHFKVKLPTFKVNGSAFCSQFTFTIANANITEMEKDVRLKTILLFVASNFFCKGTNSKLHLARDSKVVLTQFTFCKESRNPSFIINKKVLDFIS